MTSVTVTALVSGGKDSIYAAYLADTQGRTVDELVTIRPQDPESMMYHTPNLPLVALQAESWGKRHRAVEVRGEGEAAELEALHRALEGDRGWVVAGAIESSYQWARLLRVAGEVGRPVYVPLWRKDPGRVVREEIAAGLDIRLVHLAAESLDPAWLGRRLTTELAAELDAAGRPGPRVHVAGEGGEYESLVVDAPFFRSRLVWDRADEDRDAHTARLTPRDARLEPKGARSDAGTPP